MDSIDILLKPQLCSQHNVPIQAYNRMDKALCQFCLLEQSGITPVDQISNKLKQTLRNAKMELDEQRKSLQTHLESLNQYKDDLLSELKKIMSNVQYQINYMNQFKEQYKLICFSQTKECIKEIEDIQLNSQQSYKKFRSLIIQKLNDFKQKFISIDLLLKQINENQNIVENKANILDFVGFQVKNQEEHRKQEKYIPNYQSQDFQAKYYDLDDQNKILKQSPNKILKQFDNAPRQLKIEVQEMKQKIIKNQGKFQYELMRESGMKENNYCHAFAFNKNNTILIIGCLSTIKIYEFLNGKIGKEFQVLNNHIQVIYCVYFMKLSNFFISGSYDQTIIWKHDSKNQWVPQQILTDQVKVKCILMNKNEDILISGSDDRTVKFCKKVNNQWSCQQTIQTDNQVNAMSINEYENKLISCGNGAYIYVMEIQDDKQWSIKQKIDVDESGFRLCFTVGDQFVFQPETKDYLKVFNYDSNSNQFKKQSEVIIQKVQCCDLSFPCQYVKSLNILFVKHGQFLNIFQVNEGKNYELIQTIEFSHQKNQYGTVSNDGQYLVTWDEGSKKEIQVRKLKE